MAWYTSTTVRYRGRLVEVTERYGSFMSAHILKGKAMEFSDHDLARIEKLSLRGEARKDLNHQAEVITDPCSFCQFR